MRRVVAVGAIWIGLAGPTLAHRATELYIPIGQSPGLSGKVTAVGEIEAVDEDHERLTMRYSSTSHEVHCTENTRIYLDRSKARKRNEVGSLSDCRPGMSIEVKFADDERTVAQWIKLEVAD